MRRWSLIIAMLALVACGDDSPSKSDKGGNNTNNTNNTNTRNTNNVSTENPRMSECPEGSTQVMLNGMEFCARPCMDDVCFEGFECNSGFCVPSAMTANNANNENNVNNANNQTAACETRAECSNSAECVDGQCVDHQQCFGREGGDGLRSCNAVWFDCDDERKYEIDCENFEECDCVVNDVVTETFPIARVCDGDFEATIHRLANDNCGWLVPSW